MKKIFFLSIIISFFSCKKDEKISIGKSNERNITTLSVSAYDLLLSYEENEVKADDLYKDKLIEVTGAVSKIEKEDFDETICVSLAGFRDPYTIGNVKCFFLSNKKNVISNLSVNQIVTITGVYDSNSFAIVSLKDCSLKK